MDTRSPTPYPVMYDDRFVGCRFSFDTTRKAARVAESLATRPIPGIIVVDPSASEEVTRRIIRDVHDEAYVRAVETGEPRHLAESQGFDWDPGIADMALAHSMGSVTATIYALLGRRRAGTLSSGLHHAGHRRGSGYCTFNGLAAAVSVATSLGRRVLVLDFDAHAGGGTWDIVHDTKGWTRNDRVVQLDLSVTAFDMWQPEGESRLVLGDDGSYLDDVRSLLDHAHAIGPFDFVLYNAGVDPVNCSTVDGATIAERERIVSQFVGDTPAVFTLAGGYAGALSMDEVVDLHRHVIVEWGVAAGTLVGPPAETHDTVARS